MKIGGLGIVLSALWCAIPSDAATFPEQFLSRMDLAAPGMDTIARLVSAGKTDSAMVCWRNGFLRRLRGMDLGQFGWHSYQTHPRVLSFARMLVDSMTDAQYRAQSFGVDWVDTRGMHGDPGTIGTIDWIAPLTDPDGKDVYGTFKMFTPLATQFHLTRSDVYLRKYFEIVGQFCQNQKNQILSLPAASRAAYDCDWSQNAQVALDQGFRINQIVRQLGLVAKSLQPGDPKPGWDAVLGPVTNTVSNAALAKIDATVLARIVWSLVVDHPYSMFYRYKNAGAVPNQRMVGLSSLSQYGVIFPEFKDVRDSLHAMVDASMEDHLAGSVFRDGGFLEQSFNYNLSDLSEMDALLTLWDAPAEPVRMPVPHSIVRMRQAESAFRRLLALSVDPFGQIPRNGNNGYSIHDSAWMTGFDWSAFRKSGASGFESIRAGNIDPLLDGVESALFGGSAPAPSFASAAFPHVGYYCLRRDWTNKSPWLWMNGARASRGHDSPDAGAVQVVAGARQFLVGSGVQWYTTSACPASLQSEFGPYNSYFDEGSGWKSSTVLCDSTSQNRGGATVAPVSFRDGLWSASDRFDLVTTRFAEGYGSIADASHVRTVIQLRGDDAWIVSDRLSASRSHAWTQVWTFSPEFPKASVVADPATKIVQTKVSAGPSWSQSLHSNASIQLSSHYGEKGSRYLGWYKNSMGSTPVPKMDVHAVVNSDTAIITNLMVVRDAGTTAFAQRRDSSDANHAGFEIALAGSGSLRFQECRRASCDLVWDRISTRSRVTLVRRGTDGGWQGIVLGATNGGFSIDGRKLSVPFPDFEWSLTGTVWTTREVKIPDTFAWTPGPSPRQSLWKAAPRVLSGELSGAGVHEARQGDRNRFHLSREPVGAVLREAVDLRGVRVGTASTESVNLGWNSWGAPLRAHGFHGPLREVLRDDRGILAVRNVFLD